VVIVALAQPGEEPGHVLGRHLADAGPARRGERGRVAAQVSAIGLKRVFCQATLDRQVVEVAPDRRDDGDRLRDSVQLSASPGAVHGRP